MQVLPDWHEYAKTTAWIAQTFKWDRFTGRGVYDFGEETVVIEDREDDLFDVFVWNCPSEGTPFGLQGQELPRFVAGKRG